VAPEAVEAALALLLLSPHIPLLFMGEEYGERAKFYFFTDFAGELAEAVRQGRNEEFRNNKAFTEAFRHDLVPEPNSPETFANSRLDPRRSSQGEGEARARLVQRLIEARLTHIVPRLATIGGHAGKVEAMDGEAFIVSWRFPNGGALRLFANLADREASLSVKAAGLLVFAHPEGAEAALARSRLPPWSVLACLEDHN
jgi:1,4-alpha-glucan branching enzyme